MLIVKILSIFISYLILLDNILIYQQTHYKINELIVYHKKRFILDIIPIIIIFDHFLTNVKIDIIYYLYISLYFVLNIKKPKVKLVYTKRVKRMIIICLPFICLSYLSIVYFCVIKYILLVPFYLSLCFENIINKKYIIKASNKIKNFEGDVIAITASFGKTTMKHYSSSILEDLKVLATKKSYNTPLGISKVLNEEVLEIYNKIILEFGATKKDDIKYLFKYFKPNISIVGQIGYMHLNSFKSIDNIIKEKMSLIEMLDRNGIGIINYDNKYARKYKLHTHATIFTYGFTYGDFKVLNVKNNSFDFYYLKNKLYTFTHNNLSKIDIENLIPGIILGIYYKIPYEEIELKIGDLKKPTNRLEVIEYKDITIIDDSFNSNKRGAIYALDYLSKQKGIKYLITPGIVENDNILKKEYKEYVKKIIEVCDYVFIIHSYSGDILYEMLNKENVYLVNGFSKAYEIVKAHNVKQAKVLLIENDLPDIYERMVM